MYMYQMHFNMFVFKHIVSSILQGWAENSTPGIYRWNLPVFPGMANNAEVANTGK